MDVSSETKNKDGRFVYRRIDPFLKRKKKIRKHFLWAVAVLVLYAIVIANVGRIVSMFESDMAATSAVSAQLNASNPTPLLSHAFKSGHALTQLRYAGTNDHQYIKWRNRTITHLVALGIDISVIHEAIDDSILTLDETIVLRDQIHVKINKLHGVKAASTFLVGVELIPVTKAFELYLEDGEYRNKLSKSNVSILQLGSLLNANLDEAVFPDNLKIDLVAAYTKTYPQNATQVKLGQIMRFREEILNYFFGEKRDIRSSEFLASSSDRLSNAWQNEIDELVKSHKTDGQSITANFKTGESRVTSHTYGMSQ